MTKNPNHTSIWLPKSTADVLRAKMHYGQTFGSFIKELLDMKNPLDSKTLARLESYRTSPSETIDELINSVIDDNRIMSEGK